MVNQLTAFSQFARSWRLAWLVLALAYAAPLGWTAYHHVMAINEKARVALITDHRLWELHPEYHGTPQAWTRFAALLLTERQLAFRMRRKYGDEAEQLMLDWRRDLTIAQAEIVIVALASWGIPAGLGYALGVLVTGRR